jgi:nucleoside 2-deoxyribosyltransferase
VFARGCGPAVMTRAPRACNRFDSQQPYHHEVIEMEKYIGSEPQARSSSEGELPCVIVYSSYAHVKHIKVAIDHLKSLLETKQFKTVLLSDEARDLKIYFDEFVKVAKDCVLGVVVLDGFRPNVLFEFGILVGLNKPIILLKEKNAEINIKTLYCNVNDKNCKAITGLTFDKFSNLRNPSINMGSSNQFSDLSMKVTIYDQEASQKEPLHIFNQLNDNIENIKVEIEKEGERLLREKAPLSLSESYLDLYKKYVEKLYSLHLISDLKEKDIDEVFQSFKNLEKESNISLPSTIYSQIASLYTSSKERSDKNDR